VGVAFALVKVSVYSTLGLIATDRKHHASIMNTLEGVFMVGVLSAYWVFAHFIDSGNPKSQSWLQVYWVLGGLCALTFILLADYAVRRKRRPAAGRAQPLGRFCGDVQAVLRNRWCACSC
jgi:MFS family permease